MQNKNNNEFLFVGRTVKEWQDIALGNQPSDDETMLEARLSYAVCLYWGFGVPSNVKEAKKILIQAYNTGSELASGYCYFCGAGVNDDYEKAHQIFLKYVDSGNNLATITQFELASSYFHGYGCERNIEKAGKLFQQCAQKGHPLAQNMLRTRNELKAYNK